jgi:hypothetical protein
MAIEKRWAEVQQQLFSADGTEKGIITVASACGYFVKQFVSVQSLSQPAQRLQVKRVLSPTQIMVGPPDKNIYSNADLRNYTVADGAAVFAAEQERNHIPFEEHRRAIFAEEPIVADRTIVVDQCGEYWSELNPFPVTGNLTISEKGNTEPLQTTVTIASVGDQEFFTIPAKTNKLEMTMRNSDGTYPIFYYAWNNTDIANGTYKTVECGQGVILDEIYSLNTRNIYLQSNSDNTILEIEAFYEA